jgi:PAS domain-containing protein
MEWTESLKNVPVDQEKVLLTKNGIYALCTYHAKTNMFKGEQGEFPAGKSVYWTPFTSELDPTEKTAGKKARKIKNYLHSFLQQIIDTSEDVILVLDRDMNFLLVNRAYENFVGFKREYVTGKNLFEVNPQAENTTQHDYLRRAVAGESLRLTSRPGIARPDYLLESRYTPLKIEGKVEGVFVRSRVKGSEKFKSEWG